MIWKENGNSSRENGTKRLQLLGATEEGWQGTQGVMQGWNVEVIHLAKPCTQDLGLFEPSAVELSNHFRDDSWTSFQYHWSPLLHSRTYSPCQPSDRWWSAWKKFRTSSWTGIRNGKRREDTWEVVKFVGAQNIFCCTTSFKSKTFL